MFCSSGVFTHMIEVFRIQLLEMDKTILLGKPINLLSLNLKIMHLSLIVRDIYAYLRLVVEATFVPVTVTLRCVKTIGRG